MTIYNIKYTNYVPTNSQSKFNVCLYEICDCTLLFLYNELLCTRGAKQSSLIL